jgi:hypothetical protein
VNSPGFSDFLQQLGSPVAYYPSLARVLGSIKAAVFLAQLMYWTPRGKKSDGWVFKTAEEWESETGLTYEEQRGAKKILGEDGKNVIEIRYARSAHTVYYRVRREVLDALWEASGKIPGAQEHLGESLVAPGEIPGGTRGNPSSVSEITTETTPENTEQPAPNGGAAIQAQASQVLLLEGAGAVEAVVLEAPRVPRPRPARGTHAASAPGSAVPLSSAAAQGAPTSAPARAGQQAVAIFCEAWTVKYGHSYDILGKDAKALSRIFKKHGFEEYGVRLERYLMNADPFLVKLKHPATQFEFRWNALGGEQSPLSGFSRVGQKTMEAGRVWLEQTSVGAGS